MTTVLKLWYVDPWGSLRPFQGVCEVKTIFIVMLTFCLLHCFDICLAVTKALSKAPKLAAFVGIKWWWHQTLLMIIVLTVKKKKMERPISLKND